MDTDFTGFVTEFQRRIDDAESLAGMLAPGAVVIASESRLEGIAAIDAWATGRSAHDPVRHTWNNMRIERLDGGDRVILRYIATAWHGDGTGALRAMTLGDVVDVLVSAPGGHWLLSESRFNRIFKQNIV